MMSFLTLRDVDLRNKKILVRAGFDVPIKNRRVEDDTRIKNAVPTIKYLINKNASVVIICHLGRPKGRVDKKLSSAPVAKRLSELIKKKVKHLSSWSKREVKNAIASLHLKEILLLENVRFTKEEKSKNKKIRDRLGKFLASNVDLYVNEAFSNSHRDHASMTSIPRFVKSCAGLSLEAEYRIIKHTLSNPKRPFLAIIGGVKADKLKAAQEIAKIADKVLLVGSLGFYVLKQKGFEIGKTKVDSEGAPDLESIANNSKVILPEDAIVADKFDPKAKKKVVSVSQIQDPWMALDIGPRTIEKAQRLIKTSRTIIWFGPIGVFEWRRFSNGTRKIANSLARCNAIVIVGGGDSASAVDHLKLKNKMTHVSTGGGASLTLFQGKELIAIKALEESKKRFE